MFHTENVLIEDTYTQQLHINIKSAGEISSAKI